MKRRYALVLARVGKSLALAIILLLVASSLILVESASAQSETKPTVPEFTLKYVDLGTYDVPPSISPSINPYTGETTNTTINGYQLVNRTIELTIKNQPFTSYQSNGQIINLFFNVRFKGHYAQNWTNMYYTEDYIVENYSSDHTKLSYSLGQISMDELNPKGQVDFQVQAFIGSIHRDASTFWAPWVFDGESSGWSNTQTITIPETSASASPNPTPTPTVPEFSWYIILPLLASILAVALFLKHRQVNKTCQIPDNKV
jgi:hypothetical protein